MYNTEMYDPKESQDKSYTYNYETEPLTKRRDSTLDTKKAISSNYTSRQGFTQIDNYLVDKYKADLGDFKKENNFEAQKTMASS